MSGLKLFSIVCSIFSICFFQAMSCSFINNVVACHVSPNMYCSHKDTEQEERIRQSLNAIEKFSQEGDAPNKKRCTIEMKNRLFDYHYFLSQKYGQSPEAHMSVPNTITATPSLDCKICGGDVTVDQKGIRLCCFQNTRWHATLWHHNCLEDYLLDVGKSGSSLLFPTCFLCQKNIDVIPTYKNAFVSADASWQARGLMFGWGLFLGGNLRHFWNNKYRWAYNIRDFFSTLRLHSLKGIAVPYAISCLQVATAYTLFQWLQKTDFSDPERYKKILALEASTWAAYVGGFLSLLLVDGGQPLRVLQRFIDIGVGTRDFREKHARLGYKDHEDLFS